MPIFSPKIWKTAHDAFADVKGTVDVLKYTLYYLSEHRKDKSKPLTLREVLLFQNDCNVANIDIPFDSDRCNDSVNMRASYRPVSLPWTITMMAICLPKNILMNLFFEIGRKCK